MNLYQTRIITFSFILTIVNFLGNSLYAQDCNCATCPTVTAYVLAASCTNGVPNDDGYFQISAATDATHYNYVMGSDYSTGDADMANATALGAFPMQFGALANPTGSQDYTVRVFNGASDCFADVTVTLQEQDCTASCSCTEYLYLNDATLGYVHKFGIDPQSGELTEVLQDNGDYWMTGFESPHGLGHDINGFLYIGGSSEGPIYQVTCDGGTVDNDAILWNSSILYNLYNINTYNGLLFLNGSGNGMDNNEIVILDPCTGDLVGTICLDHNGNNISDWGLQVLEDGTILATSGAFSSGGNRIYSFAYSDALIDGNTCIEPLVNGDYLADYNAVYGITTDGTHLYVLAMINNFSNVHLLKIDAVTGALVASVAESSDSSWGWADGLGLIYVDEPGILYIAGREDCISLVDPSDLSYIAGVGVVENGSEPKAVAKQKECCPTPNRQTIDQVYCVSGSNEQLFLNELLNCDGIICEGQWTPLDAAAAAVYNDCDQSVSAGIAAGCYSFTKGSNGLENFPKCGAFELNFNLEILQAPNIDVSPDQTVCSGEAPTELSITTTATDIQWQMSTTSCTEGFANIDGATGATYTPPALTANTYYQAIVNATGDCSTGSCPFEGGCITVTVDPDCVPACTTPTVTAYALAASCTNGVPNDDGYLQISATEGGTHYNYVMGSDYSTGDADIANATALGAFPLQFGALPNPTGSQDYTVRVFNGASDCFMDVTVTLQEQDCTSSCSCDEYIYLNEPAIGSVLKFEVTDDTLLTEILDANGAHWYSGTELPNPHGLATDLNGHLYIGSDWQPNSPVRKFNCNGDIFPIDSTTITHPYVLTNIFSIENTLYTTRGGGPASFDLCSGEELGTMCFNDNDGNIEDTANTPQNSFWGLHYNPDLELAYATGSYPVNQGIWVFTKAELESGMQSGTCIDPLIWRNDTIDVANLSVGDSFLPSNINILSGITSDNLGNIYVAGWLTGGASGLVLKYDSNGNYIGSPPLDPAFKKTRGIVWSEITNRLYIANQTDDPTVDCISTFDATTLAYIGTAAPNPDLPTNNQAKALSILTECCPTPNRQTIDQVYCVSGSNEQLFLNELFPCDGIICEGQWTPVDATAAAVYNDCDQSIAAGIAAGCYSFTKGSDGLENYPKCGAFELNFNLEILQAPNIDVSPDQTVCSGTAPTELSITTTATDIQWQMSTTSCTQGFANIDGATGATYTPPALTANTYYQAIVNATGDCSTGSCPFEGGCITVTVDPDCVPEPTYDVSLDKTANPTQAAIGDPVIFTITVTNNGDAVTGATVTDVLPASLTYDGSTYTASVGTFDGTTWTIGAMAVGAIETIDITVTPNTEGVHLNEANVTINEPETDPDNNDDTACVSTPIEICDDGSQTVDLTAEAGFDSYQWYKDGVAIAGAVNQMYQTTEAGNYNYTVNGGTLGEECTNQMCCDVVIVAVPCAICPPNLCIPITINKINN